MPTVILRQFPGTPARNSAAAFSYFGRHNVIVHARSSEIAYAEHTAPLSIKTTRRGREVYEIGQTPLAVTEDCYLILNDEQPYASRISSANEVESFCLFFRAELGREVLSAKRLAAERLLDDPARLTAQSVSFAPQLHRHDQIISPLIEWICARIEAGLPAPLWLDEQFHALMWGLVRVYERTSAEIAAMPALRPSTRFEIHRRLYRARDFIDSCADEALDLAAIARVACLSEHHFLRLFKRVFRQTPHQYLTERRLQMAAGMLWGTDRPVGEICLEVGFEDPSSFARLFKRRFGLPPQQFRRSGSSRQR